VGPRGAGVTFSRGGSYANLGLPGTGLSWRGRIDGGRGRVGSIARQKSPTASTGSASPAQPVENPGKEALEAAIGQARARRPFRDTFDAAQDKSVPQTASRGTNANLILEGRIGRSQFLVGALGLSGLLFLLALLRDTFPRGLAGDAFFVAALALGLASALLVACRSRAAGVPPWITFLAIGSTALMAPGLLTFIFLAQTA
jgi:hypothetical protein